MNNSMLNKNSFAELALLKPSDECHPELGSGSNEMLKQVQHDTVGLILQGEKHRASTESAGFTLVELMLAIVVLTIGIMSLITTIIPAMHLEETSRSSDIAKSAATNKLEEIAGYDFDSICTVFSGTNFAAGELGNTAGYVSIDNSNTELLDITVTLSWQSAAFSNITQSLQMKTMLTRSDQ